MLKKMRTLGITVTILLSQMWAAQAQPTPQQTDGWNVVRAVPAGELLLVELKDGKSIKGKLSATSETGLTIQKSSRDIPVNRESVRRIFRLVGKTRGQSTLKGAGIGAATGAGVGLVVYLPARDDIVGWVVPAFAVIGTGVGAAIGAITGGGQAKVLVYEAQPLPGRNQN